MIIQIAQKIINKIANRFREVMYLPILIFKKYFINTLNHNIIYKHICKADRRYYDHP